jgi:hypothetical protein
MKAHAEQMGSAKAKPRGRDTMTAPDEGNLRPKPEEFT